MHTPQTDELHLHQQQVLDSAWRGEAAVVIRGGAPIVVAVPPGSCPKSHQVRQALAAALLDSEQACCHKEGTGDLRGIAG